MNILVPAILSTLPAACFKEDVLMEPMNEDLYNESNMIYLLRKWSKYTRQLEKDVDELQAIVDAEQSTEGE